MFASVLWLCCSWTASVSAQVPTLELSFTPIDRAQIAVWVERDDGTFMGTLALTYAVAKEGIGNRPGASQMNSGFRWPYGRREGVLPVWAHRRAAAPGAEMWKRIIFQDRSSEGFASRTSNDQSQDSYYCLSFRPEHSGKEALDAVTCASVFSSDKGRFMTAQDEQRGYSEPYEDSPGQGRKRPLSVGSLYPPRRDIVRCSPPSSSCNDHPDVDAFRTHALEVMPELDVITRATLQGRRQASWLFDIPADWPRHANYRLFIEVNVEGDYNDTYSTSRYPTPRSPASGWDSWALDYGYAFRGQPSVVYALDFGLSSPNESTTLDPVGFGALHGESGELFPLDASISNDPGARPGSGADRLIKEAQRRAHLRVMVPDASACQQSAPPPAVRELSVEPHPDKRHRHMWAKLQFKAPDSSRRIASYVVEVKAEGSEWEPAYTPDEEQELLPVALDMCSDPTAPGRNRCLGMSSGTELTATLAGLRQLTHYQVRVIARDGECGAMGAEMIAELDTPEREFATVTPCFVATAAYGSPLASEIGVLRSVRDRYLLPTWIGRQLVSGYYAIGPTLAEEVRERPWLRGVVRAILTPVVEGFQWWLDE